MKAKSRGGEIKERPPSRNINGLAKGAMPLIASNFREFVLDRGFVDEECCALAGDDEGFTRHRVARETEDDEDRQRTGLK